MAMGLTRKEQWALIGTILAIALALAVHHARDGSAPDRVEVQGQGVWRRLSVIDASQLPAAGKGRGAAGADAPVAATEKQGAPQDAAVDLNTATLEDLDRLPGIGPAKAGAILETRRRLGGFQSIEQLTEVHGIGPATVEKLRPYVRVTPPAATADPSAGLVAPVFPIGPSTAGRQTRSE